MKKLIIIPIILLFILLGCTQEVDTDMDKNTIGVSIVPQETFLRAIVGDKYEIITLIPTGSSPASHQPSIKELQGISQSDLYFSIGVGTEVANILPTISEYDNLKIINLADEVDKFYSARYFSDDHIEEDDHDHEADEHDHEEDEDAHEDAEDDHGHSHAGRDPHIWLSPKRAIKIVEIMTEELSQVYPEDEAFFKENAKKYIQELEELDLYAKAELSRLNDKSFLIYHPAYGYFAEDYDLEMIPIEIDGKEASIKKLDSFIHIAEEKGLSRIYYQEEMSKKQAQLIANEIDGEIVQLKPLSANYIENQRNFIKELLGE